MEVSVLDLNQECPEEDLIEINPIYRLQDVFGTLFDKNITGMKQTRVLFFDVCMHYIVQLDLREGLSEEDYYCKLAEDDIRNPTSIIFKDYETPDGHEMVNSNDYSISDEVWNDAKNVANGDDLHTICQRVIAAKVAYEYFMYETN